MEEIREQVTRRFNKYKFKPYIESDEDFIKRTTEYNYLIKTTNMPFMDIVKEVRIKYKYNYNILKPEIDLMQHSFKFNALTINIPLESIKTRYYLPYEEVDERMMYRIELYKEGWDVEQVERYIYRYILKEEYNLNKEDIERLTCLYYNVMSKIEIYKNIKKTKIGRPSLPPLLKEYIKGKHIDKTRDDMRKKYEYALRYENIKDKLLTPEDLDKLESQVSDKKLLEKLKFLAIV